MSNIIPALQWEHSVFPAVLSKRTLSTGPRFAFYSGVITGQSLPFPTTEAAEPEVQSQSSILAVLLLHHTIAGTKWFMTRDKGGMQNIEKMVGILQIFSTESVDISSD